MNWKLTLTKGIVVGVLAALGVTAADIQSVSAPWAGVAMVILEVVRDLIKAKFGAFVPAEAEPTGD